MRQSRQHGKYSMTVAVFALAAVMTAFVTDGHAEAAPHTSETMTDKEILEVSGGPDQVSGTSDGEEALPLPDENKLKISRVEFERDFLEEGNYRLTNGSITMHFVFGADIVNVEKAYYFWADDQNNRLPVGLEEDGGSFVVDREGKGTVTLVCIDAEGNVMTAEEPGLWIEKTAPVIDMGEDSDMISMVPPAVLKVTADDGENGSGVESFRYQLDGGEDVEVSGGEFELSFEENEEHTITVIAVDRVGNENKVTKRLSVNVAPIVKVTIPTDIDLVVLSSPVGDKVNIFSEEWEVVNKSNVPVKLTITEYSMNSDYTGDFEDSYLNLKMKCGSHETKLPLGFTYQTDVYQFVLGKAEYSGQNEYVSSDGDARAILSYEGYAGAEFNKFLSSHKAVFHMTFVFEPVTEE